MRSFSAALLAGGQSRRMGRDKALLPHPAGGLFWEHQLAVLEELKPEEIFWSGPPRPGIPARVRVMEDGLANAGPLAGLSACLGVLQSDLLLVLAVDLASITADFLRRLLEASGPTHGVAVKIDSFYEPLAAVYPRALRELVAAHLAAGRYALQDLLQEAERVGLMHAIAPASGDRAQLRNVNEPGDLAGGA